jgi:hypothetical protein
LSGARIPSHEVARVVELLKKTRYSEMLKRATSGSAVTLEPDVPLEFERDDDAADDALDEKPNTASSSSSSSSSFPSSSMPSSGERQRILRGPSTQSSSESKSLWADPPLVEQGTLRGRDESNLK